MDVPTLDFVRVCSLAELRAKGRIVLHGPAGIARCYRIGLQVAGLV
jgi:hypothetical protein